jgi:hypothetical protein
MPNVFPFCEWTKKIIAPSNAISQISFDRPMGQAIQILVLQIIIQFARSCRSISPPICGL